MDCRLSSSSKLLKFILYGRDVPNKEEDWDSYPNTTRYKNPEFDKLYEKAMRVPLAETYAYLQEAEKNING